MPTYGLYRLDQLYVHIWRNILVFHFAGSSIHNSFIYDLQYLGFALKNHYYSLHRELDHVLYLIICIGSHVEEPGESLQGTLSMLLLLDFSNRPPLAIAVQGPCHRMCGIVLTLKETVQQDWL